MLLQSLGFSLGSTHGRAFTSSGGRRVGMTGLAGEGVHVGGCGSASCHSTPATPGTPPTSSRHLILKPPRLDVDDRSPTPSPSCPPATASLAKPRVRPLVLPPTQRQQCPHRVDSSALVRCLPPRHGTLLPPMIIDEAAGKLPSGLSPSPKPPSTKMVHGNESTAYTPTTKSHIAATWRWRPSRPATTTCSRAGSG